MSNCKHCMSDDIGHFIEEESISYKGSELTIAIEYSICNGCQREFLSKQQILNNDTLVRDAKKSADGLLTSAEIFNAREKLGLTQVEASIVFGGGKNAFSKYERAEVSQSVAMDKLIRICLHHPNIFEELVMQSSVNSSTPNIYIGVDEFAQKLSSQDRYISTREIPICNKAYG